MTFIGDANDPATILADSDVYYATYCAASDNDEAVPPGAAWIDSNFTSSRIGQWWYIGRVAPALVQMYDLVAPLDGVRAGQYLERLRRIGGALLNNRDDVRGFPADAFRGRVMPAWGGYAEDRDWRWNTDVVIAGLFTYAMAAFARRVADNPALHGQYAPDAIRFVTATLETYEAFRPQLYLVDNDAQAYFVLPSRYAQLQCNRNDMSEAAKHSCAGYRDGAGKPISYNENLSMMKALAEAALAGDSALYRGSPDATPARLRLATEEAPLLIAKNFTFFDKHLRSKTLSDGTPYFEWAHEQRRWRIQDTAHGGFELDCLAVLLDEKIRLNALLERAGRSERVALSTPLFVRFANAFLRKIWQYDFQDPNGIRNALAENVDGTGDRSAHGCTGWIPLAQFNPWVWTRCLDTTFHPPGFLQDDNHAALLRYRQFNRFAPYWNTHTTLELNGGWTDGSAQRAVISHDFNSLTIDMSDYHRPAAHGSIVDASTITVSFPDDATYIGQLQPPNTIRWSNGSTWTKFVNTVVDLNGNWTDGSTRRAVILEDIDSITIDMSDYHRPAAHGSIVDASTITVSFPDDATYIGQLQPPNTIRWSNGSTWTKA